MTWAGLRWSTLLSVLVPSAATTGVASFCTAEVYQDYVICDDGVKLGEGQCCSNGVCPSSCRSSKSNQASSTCDCEECPLRRRDPMLSMEEQWVRAHNFFRCRHGQPSVTWSDALAAKARKAAQASCAQSVLVQTTDLQELAHAESQYLGFRSPEAVTEQWYSQIRTAAAGVGYVPGTSADDSRYAAAGNAVNQYTALIWQSTGQIGCSMCKVKGSTKGSANEMAWVCHYAHKMPNSGGLPGYKANVPQNVTPINSTGMCCQATYGPGAPEFVPAGAVRPAFGAALGFATMVLLHVQSI